MGDLPKYRIYISNAEGEINFKRGGELCALWENETRDGRRYLAGKYEHPDGTIRKVQGWPVGGASRSADEAPTQASEFPDGGEDIPF